jgi:hypothetical protein
MPVSEGSERLPNPAVRLAADTEDQETSPTRREVTTMRDTGSTGRTNLSRELPCLRCDHAPHTYLPCSDTCDCYPAEMPGEPPLRVPRDPATATAA